MKKTTKPAPITFTEACAYARAGNWLWVKGYLHQQGRDDLAEDVERYEDGGASEGQYRELLDRVLPYRNLSVSESIAMGRA